MYPEPSLIVSTIILPVGLGSAAHSRGRVLEMISRDRVWPVASILNESNMRLRSKKYVAGGWREDQILRAPLLFTGPGLSSQHPNQVVHSCP